MVYIVEVLERMLILAASRLSMIVLEKETQWKGTGMETEGCRHGKGGTKKTKKLNRSHQLFMDYSMNSALHDNVK